MRDRCTPHTRVGQARERRPSRPAGTAVSSAVAGRTSSPTSTRTRRPPHELDVEIAVHLLPDQASATDRVESGNSVLELDQQRTRRGRHRGRVDSTPPCSPSPGRATTPDVVETLDAPRRRERRASGESYDAPRDARRHQAYASDIDPRRRPVLRHARGLNRLATSTRIAHGESARSTGSCRSTASIVRRRSTRRRPRGSDRSISLRACPCRRTTSVHAAILVPITSPTLTAARA